MEFSGLRVALKTKVEPMYLLFGTDMFLVNKSVELISEALGAPEIIRLDESAGVDQIKAATGSISMFNEKTLVVVQGVTDKLLKEFGTYNLSNPNCALVLISSSEKAPAAKINATPVGCNPLGVSVLVQLIVRQGKESGVEITADGATLIAKYCKNDYAIINNELKKILAFYDGGRVCVKEVEALITKYEEHIIFDLSNAILKKDLVKADEIYQIIKQTSDDYAIFGMLQSTFRRLYFALTAKGAQEEVGKTLGVNPYAILYARRDGKHLAGGIAELYGLAIDLEYQIKSGKIGIESATTLLMMEACK